ncbi:MAG: hypothetical protein K9K62_01405 [Desulfobacteraceae bacterium]|nr:hypothetical protein [Desulfobacteraceae bacterium]
MKTPPMKYLLLSAILVLCGGAVCRAAPDLDHFTDIAGVRIYRDHENPSKWYMMPAQPLLDKRADGTPDYGLALYRYLGRKGTSDSGDFWVRGVLTFGIDRPRKSEISTKIRKELRTRGIGSPKTSTMPISETRISLMFADAQDSRSYSTRWKGGTLVLPLNARLAEILWDAVTAGQTQVSLAIDETLAGVRKTGDQWEPAFTAQTWVVPVEMDMNAHPAHFRRMDLGARMKVGYTGLDVFCFDFLENLEENLYAKIVEVAIPTAGRDLVETLTFRKNGDYRRRIEFKLAKDLDRPYRYRISRIYKDGSKKTGRWQKKSGEALLDITAYENTADRAGKTGQAAEHP